MDQLINSRLSWLLLREHVFITNIGPKLDCVELPETRGLKFDDSQMAADQAQSSEPWWAGFSEVKASCRRMEASQVKELLEADEAAGSNAEREFLLVDVRRTDWGGGTIKTSINFPAQSLYQTRPVIYQLCKQAGIKNIIFYCGK